MKIFLVSLVVLKCVASTHSLHHGVLQRSTVVFPAVTIKEHSILNTNCPRNRSTSLQLVPKQALVSSGRTVLPKSIAHALRGGAIAAASPPLSQWLGPALACACSYALYNVFIKKGSASIDPMLGGVILQLVAAGLGSVLLGILKTTKKTSFLCQAVGVKWAIAAGVAVGLAELLSFYVSGMGVQAMQSIPIIIGGSVLFGTVLGAVWLKETLSVRGWLGVLLISLGIALVGLDPGSTSLH